MQTLTIAGVGLVGGSFALAARKAGVQTILGVSSPRTIDEALARGVIDRGVTLEEAAAVSDILYLSQPVNTIVSTLAALQPFDRAGLFVTDAGSTKKAIVAAGLRSLRKSQFIGGHPMAGKASRGVAEASGDLFDGRTYVFTPSSPSEMDTPEARAFIELVGRTGARVAVMTAEEHDRTVAFTSHLPQLLSTALSSMLADELADNRSLEVAGPGLLDMTRLGMSDFDLWRDIVNTNVSEIDHALSVYIDKLTEIRHNLQTPNLGHEFRAAQEMSYRLRRQR